MRTASTASAAIKVSVPVREDQIGRIIGARGPDDAPTAGVRTPTSASRPVAARLATLATPRANQSVKAELARQRVAQEGKGVKSGPGGTVVQPRMMF